eukprot:7155564-Pyramimonas_sp.AAC.1
MYVLGKVLGVLRVCLRVLRVCLRGAPPTRRGREALRVAGSFEECPAPTGGGRRDGDPGRGGLQGARPRAWQLGGPASRGL